MVHITKYEIKIERQLYDHPPFKDKMCMTVLLIEFATLHLGTLKQLILSRNSSYSAHPTLVIAALPSCILPLVLGNKIQSPHPTLR